MIGLLTVAALPGQAAGGWASDITTIGPAGTAGIAGSAGREVEAGEQLLPGTGGNPSKPCHDGDIIIPGGETYGEFGAANTATGLTECFAPTTSGTTTTASASSMDSCAPSLGCVARAAHVAFQVPSTGGAACAGKIVAAGGYTVSGATTATTEVYDPLKNTWSDLNTSMSVARWGIARGVATVQLQDGRFLVAGGSPNTTTEPPSNAVDIFDIAKCQWNVNDSGQAQVPSTLNKARALTAAGVLNNGVVLVCGGFITPGPPGGTPGASPSSDCESYAPPASTTTCNPCGSWVTKSSDNMNPVAGRGAPANASYRFNDTSCSPSGTTDYSCSERLPGTTTAFPHGRILIASGADNNTYTGTASSNECDDTTCSQASTMQLGTLDSEAVTMHGGSEYSSHSNSLGAPVLLCGGYNTATTITPACEIYTPSTSTSSGTWASDSVMSPMPNKRADFVFMENCVPSGSTAPTGEATCPTSIDEVTAAGGTSGYDATGTLDTEVPYVDQLRS